MSQHLIDKINFIAKIIAGAVIAYFAWSLNRIVESIDDQNKRLMKIEQDMAETRATLRFILRDQKE